MDENLSHDWISAYADGELSPAERARVEEQLRESPEAMRELFEIRALSGLLREAVAVDVPADFSIHVMRQAERESLIGKSPAESSDALRRSRNWIPVVSIGSTVACLAVVLLLVGPGMNRTDSPAPDSTVASNTRSSAHADRFEAIEFAAERYDDAGLPASAGSGATSSENLSSFSFTAPEMKEMGAAQGASLNVISPINLKETSEIGDVVRALKMSAGHVAIVELTVVDRQEGIDHLQFILSGLSIKDDPSVPRKKLTDGEGELYTVFVEAAPAQMQAALTRMQQDMEFATVEVSTSIPADDLEPYFVSNGYATLNVNRARSFYKESLDQAKELEDRKEAPAKPSPDGAKKADADTIVAKTPRPASGAKDSKTDELESIGDQENFRTEQYRFSRRATVRLPEKATIEFIEQNKLERELAPANEFQRTIIADNLKQVPQPQPSPPATTPVDEPAARPEKPLEAELDAVPAESLLQVLFVVRLESAETPLPAPKPASR